MVEQSTEHTTAVGRRKTSTARVIVRPGNGEFTVNGRPIQEYFPRLLHRKRAEEALKVTEYDGKVDVRALVRGGGVTGQADALRLAVARAILERDEESRPALRRDRLLTRDSRKVERKKPGRPKARKRFQFSKR
ncbi:MAG: 30S ribosomal protein S9 [Gemmatimonadales bacterium]|jgi:small subunit ribosomal protein S9|nr:MAG: 30S ribosomal protein S9 [Gemmatimonadales bacterium]